ncbi:MAG: hypothetical protein P8179_14410 [Candidatus Thiodiazotropha sp.]|jgi:hypothetical protein
MQYNNNVYRIITVVESLIIMSSLAISSLGVVFDYAYLVYFWYLALGGILMMMTTTITLGVTFLLCRLFSSNAVISRSYDINGILSKSKSLRV